MENETSESSTMKRFVRTVYMIFTIVIIVSLIILWAKVNLAWTITLLCLVIVSILVIELVFYRYKRHAR